MPQTPHIHVCHLSSVHRALDTRILAKECISLTQKYRVSLIARHPQEEVIQGVHIIPLAAPPNRFFRFLVTGTMLLFKALQQKADLYHFHDPELIPLGLLLRRMGKKVIYDVHENVGQDIKNKNWLPLKGMALAVYKKLERRAARQLGLVLANASSEAYFKPIARQYVVVQNYAPAEMLAPYRKKTFVPSNKLLLVGFLNAGRGLHILAEALSLLKRRNIVLELHCVGNITPEARAALEKLPYFGEIREQLHFEGYKMIPEAYAGAAAYLAGMAVLEDVENHRMNYPTKLFEYMAVGLPVLVSDFPLYTEVVEQYRCGLAVNPADAEKVADALEWLYTHQQDAFQMGMNGLEAMQQGHFNWKGEEEKLLAFYEKILS